MAIDGTNPGGLTDLDVKAIAKEIAKVWHRGVSGIDGRTRPNVMVPLPALKNLEALTETWDFARGKSRQRVVFEALRTSLYYVDPDDVPLEDLPSTGGSARETIATLLGLEERWSLHSRVELSVAAMKDITKLHKSVFESTDTKEARESAWRARLFETLANGVVRAAAANFEIPLGGSQLDRIPRDLDPDPPILIGRDEAIDRLLLATGTGALLITGESGVGKTSVAISVANKVAETFPDGQIQIDFHGYSDLAPVTAEQGMRGVLRRLGYAEDSLPTTFADLKSAYRSALADRTTLLLYDNIASLDIALDLLLGNGSSTIIFTSRRELIPLLAKTTMHHEHLDPLVSQDAEKVLQTYFGNEFAMAESTAVAQLVEVCGGLPLALTIVGARLRGGRSSDLSQAAAALIENRMKILELHVPGVDAGVASALKWSFGLLSKVEQAAIAALAVTPVFILDVRVVEAMELGEPQELLDRFVYENLLHNTGSGHYMFHDLVRLFLRSSHIPPLGTRQELFELQVKALVLLNNNVHDIIEYVRKRLHRNSLQDFIEHPLPLLKADAFYPASEENYLDAVNLLRGSNYFVAIGAYEHAIDAIVNSLHAILELGAWELFPLVFRFIQWTAETRGKSVDPPSSSEVAGITWEEGLQRFEQVADGAIWRTLVFWARSGWEDRIEPIFEKSAQEFAMGRKPDASDALAIRSDVYLSASPADLVSLVLEARDIYWTEEMVQSAIDTEHHEMLTKAAELEWLAHRALLGGDMEIAMNRFSDLLSLSKSQAASVASIELLWSFEPPLVQFAILLKLSDDKQGAHDVMKWVQDLYSSRQLAVGHAYAVRTWCVDIENELLG